MSFKSYNPAVIMLYYLVTVGIAMFVWNPVILALCLFGGVAYSVKNRLHGGTFGYAVMFILVILINPIVTHKGVTPLFFINNNAVTLEAVVYGFAAAVMLLALVIHSRLYSLIMTSDKFIYLCGRAFPKLSLVLSMSMRFLPLFVGKYKRITKAQKAMGLYSAQSYVDRIHFRLRVFSAVTSWALENAVETSMSMNARCYGKKKRSTYTMYSFCHEDFIMCGTVILLGSICVWGNSAGAIGHSYYPRFSLMQVDYCAVIIYVSYAMLAFLPFAVDVKENIKWKYYISKI